MAPSYRPDPVSAPKDEHDVELPDGTADVLRRADYGNKDANLTAHLMEKAGTLVLARHSRAASQDRTTTRLSADLPNEDGKLLAEVALQTGSNKVTTIVRAIRVLAELIRAERDGGELTIRYPDGRRERLRFL